MCTSIVRRLKKCIHSERGKKAGEKESIATLAAIGEFINEKILSVNIQIISSSSSSSSSSSIHMS